jgi:uncharacterized protein
MRSMALVLQEISGIYWVGHCASLDSELVALLDQQSPDFWSITHTAEELSVVSSVSSHERFTAVEGPWSLFRIEGQLDFSLTGILSTCSTLLAEAGISLFAVSTFDTDYFLVPRNATEEAVTAWNGGTIEVQRCS